MIQAADFLSEARRRGFNFFTGVPCSFLTPLINTVIGDANTPYVGAASEGEAVGIAAGAWLAGRQTVVMCQNSGLGNAVNPLTSLNRPFLIPTLLVTTWRGQPGLKDAPQHEMMGEITAALLDVMKIAHRPFPDADCAIGPALDAAAGVMNADGLSYALVMAKGSVAGEALIEPERTPPPAGDFSDLSEGNSRPGRLEILENVLQSVPPEAAIIATTGKCGRELFTLDDRPQNFYQIGSMGCAGGMGLGIALNVSSPVVVLDGDGAALMKMGTIPTIGAYAPENLTHVIIDNGVYDSTGGQKTVSSHVDFARVAVACGYAAAFSADTTAGFTEAFATALKLRGPVLIHVRIRPGSMEKLGRPTVNPADMARRMRDFLIPYRKVQE